MYDQWLVTRRKYWQCMSECSQLLKPLILILRDILVRNYVYTSRYLLIMGFRWQPLACFDTPWCWIPKKNRGLWVFPSRQLFNSKSQNLKERNELSPKNEPPQKRILNAEKRDPYNGPLMGRKKFHPMFFHQKPNNSGFLCVFSKGSPLQEDLDILSLYSPLH